MKLDLGWGDDAPAQRPRPLPKPRPRKKPRTALLLAAVAVLALTMGLGARMGRASLTDDVTALQQRVDALEVTTAAATDEAAFWRSEAESATTAYEAVESDLASMTASLDFWHRRAEEASETVAALKAEAAKATVTPQSYTPPAGKDTGATWSREKVASTLRAAADHYGLTDAQTAWVVETGTRIAYRESTYRVAATNPSGAAGLFQFMPSWAPLEQRLDPTWSCYRFVKVYADSGEAGIAKHWRATYGGV